MNSLTVNLHLLMASFYQPKKGKSKILIESGAFPSDAYVVDSQARFHGLNPKSTVIEVKAKGESGIIDDQHFLDLIEKQGDEIALILLGNPNYLTGQVFDIPAIVTAAHKKGIIVGVDLAHGIGNIELALRDWNVDFAAWCSYKYLNSGPGAIAGVFIHENHCKNFSGPRFEGWWGNDKSNRFEMKREFKSIGTAEAWQLSNPPIFQLAALRASLEIFDQVGMSAIVKKRKELTGYLDFLFDSFPEGKVQTITPRDPDRRGTMISFRIKGADSGVADQLARAGVVLDFRSPDIFRVSPVALYTRFQDCADFMDILKETMS